MSAGLERNLADSASRRDGMTAGSDALNALYDTEVARDWSACTSVCTSLHVSALQRRGTAPVGAWHGPCSCVVPDLGTPGDLRFLRGWRDSNPRPLGP
jgi:hypothetical protein